MCVQTTEILATDRPIIDVDQDLSWRHLVQWEWWLWLLPRMVMVIGSDLGWSGICCGAHTSTLTLAELQSSFSWPGGLFTWCGCRQATTSRQAEIVLNASAFLAGNLRASLPSWIFSISSSLSRVEIIVDILHLIWSLCIKRHNSESARRSDAMATCSLPRGLWQSSQPSTGPAHQCHSG